MLYDPKWSKPSLSGFIAWLEQQNPKARYDYRPAGNCAIGKYFKHLGTTYHKEVFEMIRELYDWNQHITHPKPHTFGAALSRARAALKIAESG